VAISSEKLEEQWRNGDSSTAVATSSEKLEEQWRNGDSSTAVATSPEKLEEQWRNGDSSTAVATSSEKSEQQRSNAQTCCFSGSPKKVRPLFPVSLVLSVTVQRKSRRREKVPRICLFQALSQ
jgi:hypothetical protein